MPRGCHTHHASCAQAPRVAHLSDPVGVKVPEDGRGIDHLGGVAGGRLLAETQAHPPVQVQGLGFRLPRHPGRLPDMVYSSVSDRTMKTACASTAQDLTHGSEPYKVLNTSKDRIPRLQQLALSVPPGEGFSPKVDPLPRGCILGHAPVQAHPAGRDAVEPLADHVQLALELLQFK